MDLDPWPNNAEAGPSRWRDPDPDTAKRRRQRPTPQLYHPALPLILLPFLAPAFAAPAPPHHYPYAAATPTRSPEHASLRQRGDSEGGNTRVAYITSVTTPTNLPTAVTTVDERILPRIVTRGTDGTWTPVDNAWKLYGVVGGTPTGDGKLFADDAFLVQSSLPKGWGQQSNRTSIYRVPLIVIASVVAAFVIVVIVIVLVFQRKKAHRKAKRRAERLRRKAMAAAGYDENSINGTAAEAAFKEKLAEMERQHRQKKRKDGGQTFVKGKVGRWASGVRKRKGKAVQKEPVVEVIQEDKPDEIPGNRARSPSLHTVSDVVAGSFDGPQEPSPETSIETSEETPVPRQSIGAPYFPPAYRPASVRSYERTEGESSSPNTASGSDAPSGMDKTRAPGYYPAPATEDSEQALEVVSRAEGKMPMPPADEAAEERMRHIATDDKRALERLRLGASAPPVTGEAPSGPSAPRVEVDQDGFETVEMLQHPGPSEPSEPRATLHPDIPAPPLPTSQRYDEVIEELDELRLLPSAPPVTVSSEPSTPSAPPAPSAPPGEDDLHEEAPSAPPAPSAPAPSAPPPDDEDEPTASSSALPASTSDPRTPLAETSTSTTHTIPSAPPIDADDGELESEPRRPEQGVKRLYLPRYEP